jgi:hypothetical protein
LDDEDYDSAECIRAMVVAGYLISIAINSSLTLAYLPKQGARNVAHELNNLFHIFHIKTIFVNDGVMGPEFDAAYPQRWIGKVTVLSTDGRTLHGRVEETKGDPGNTLSREEITAKAPRLIAYECPAGRPHRSTDVVARLLVRINAEGTPRYADDLRMLTQLCRIIWYVYRQR